MGNSFNKDKLKVSSKMGANRIALQTKKMENALIKNKREIAVLVNAGKQSKARIKVEAIIRDENIIMAYELTGNFCELVHQRALFIAQEKQCPEDILETVCTIIYAAPRCDIKELTELTHLFGAKWGKRFIDTYKENKTGHVSPRIVKALSTTPPAFDQVIEKLKEICKQHDVTFSEENITDEFASDSGPVQKEATQQVDQDQVNKLVRYLMDPSTFDLTDQQKHDLCRTHGGSPAECAAAVCVANQKIAQQQAAPAPSAIPAQQREYTVTFNSRPFGMQWTETNDQRNLYVSSVDHGLLAHNLGVTQGSLIIAVNGRIVENMGAAQVFQISKAQPLPLSITFRALTNVVNQPRVQVQPAMPHLPQQHNPTPPGHIQSIPPPDYKSVNSEPAKSDTNSLDFGLPDVPGMEKRQPGSSDNLAFDLPDPPSSSNNAGPGAPGNPVNDPDYDDLEARFAALRNGV